MTEAERLANALDCAVKEEDPEDNVIMVARWFVEDSSKELRRLLSESLKIEELHAQAKRELFDAMQLNKELVEALELMLDFPRTATAKIVAEKTLEKAKK